MGTNNPRAQQAVKQRKRRSVAQSGRVVDTGASGALRRPDADQLSGELSQLPDSLQLSDPSKDLPDTESATESDEAHNEDAAEAPARQAQARLERIERAEREERKRKRRRRIRRALIGLVLFVLLVCAGLLIAFGIFRWQTYDDAADIQGTWYHEETSMPVTITEDEIVLTDDVAYRYVLDPEAKTILFKFGNMEGGGRYRFALDRQELVITDGSFDWWSNFADDALWTAQSLIAQYAFAQEVPLASGDEHETVFTREKP